MNALRIFGTVLVLCMTSVSLEEPNYDKMTINAALSRLIKATELKNLMTSSSKFSDKFRVLEANYGSESKRLYDAGHINKAIYVDLFECTDGPSKLFPRPVPKPECFRDYLGSLGISNKHNLIIYDRSPMGFYSSPRLWWTLKYMGQENVSILNGGLDSWNQNGFELSTEKTNFKEENFVLQMNPNILRNYEQIIENKEEQIIDVRPPKIFDQGAIPDSINVPYNDLFDQNTGLFKTKDQLLEVFKKHNVDFSKPLVASCMTGTTASSLSLALDLIGVKDVPVYIGSWTEYAQRTYA